MDQLLAAKRDLRLEQELKKLDRFDVLIFPLNPQGDFSPPVPQGSGGRLSQNHATAC